MHKRHQTGLSILVKMSIVIVIGAYAAIQGAGWPAETWLCVAGWVVFGVIAFLVPARR